MTNLLESQGYQPGVIEPIPERTIDALSDPIKMITVLALAALPDEAHVLGKIAEKANDLQGASLVRKYLGRTITNHCDITLAPAGHVEMSEVPMKTNPKRFSRTALFTEKGRLEGMVPVGAWSVLQLSVPWNGFLELTMGKRLESHANPRPFFYEKLLARPRGASELSDGCDIARSAVSRYIRNLTESGVLSYKDLKSPANRMFRISSEGYHGRTDLGEPYRAVVEAAEYFRGQEQFEVSGQQLLEQACASNPRLDPKDIWYSLSGWYDRSNRSSFVRSRGKVSGQKVEVSISDTFRPHLEQLTETRRLLMAEGEEAVTFRERSWRDAWEMINEPELIGRVLAAQADAKRTNKLHSWLPTAEDILASAVAAGHEGIDAIELHRQTTALIGRTLGFDYFCEKLKDSRILRVSKRRVTKHRNKLAYYVTPPPITFSRDWAKSVACKNEDPDLFFPISDSGLSIIQAEKAKKICSECPVILPCLKAALDLGTNTGVQGGVWFDQPGIHTERLKARVAHVKITK